MTNAARTLAAWAAKFEPNDADLTLADRALRDTVAVASAAREHPVRHLFDELSDAGRWAALAHVLDFDDLHLPSTTHVSAVCVPAALTGGGGAPARVGDPRGGGGAPARVGDPRGRGGAPARVGDPQDGGDTPAHLGDPRDGGDAAAGGGGPR